MTLTAKVTITRRAPSHGEKSGGKIVFSDGVVQQFRFYGRGEIAFFGRTDAGRHTPVSGDVAQWMHAHADAALLALR